MDSDGPDLRNILYIEITKTAVLPSVLFVYILSHAFTHSCVSRAALEKHHVANNMLSQAVSDGDGE